MVPDAPPDFSNRGNRLFSEISGGFEFHHFAGRNLDLLLGLGIDACAGLFLNYGECSETDELYFVVVGKCLLDGFKSSFEGCFCCDFVQLCFCSDLVN